jgi:hypothetical protein
VETRAQTRVCKDTSDDAENAAARPADADDGEAIAGVDVGVLTRNRFGVVFYSYSTFLDLTFLGVTPTDARSAAPCKAL